MLAPRGAIQRHVAGRGVHRHLDRFAILKDDEFNGQLALL